MLPSCCLRAAFVLTGGHKNAWWATHRHPHRGVRSSSPGYMGTHGDVVYDSRQQQRRRRSRCSRCCSHPNRSRRRRRHRRRRRRRAPPSSVENRSHRLGARRAQEPRVGHLDLRKSLSPLQGRCNSPQHRRERRSVFLEPGGSGARVRVPVVAVAITADSVNTTVVLRGSRRRRRRRVQRGAPCRCRSPSLVRFRTALGASGAASGTIPAASGGGGGSSEPSEPTRCPKVNSRGRVVLQDGCKAKKRVLLERLDYCCNTGGGQARARSWRAIYL